MEGDFLEVVHHLDRVRAENRHDVLDLVPRQHIGRKGAVQLIVGDVPLRPPPGRRAARPPRPTHPSPSPATPRSSPAPGGSGGRGPPPGSAFAPPPGKR